MAGVMEPSTEAPRLRKPRRRLRCLFGRHVLRGTYWYIEGSHWKTLIKYCVLCGHLEDAHARNHRRH